MPRRRALKQVAIILEASNAYGRAMLHGVAKFHQDRQGWSVHYYPRDAAPSLPSWLRSWHGDGVLAQVTSADMARQLRATGVPVIDLSGTADTGFPSFGPDHEQVCRMAVEHLLEHGFKHFGFVASAKPLDAERGRCFGRVVRELGYDCLQFHPGSPPRTARDWQKLQARGIQWLTELPKPVGIMGCHDEQAQHVVDGCRVAGLSVPDEVGVIGVENDSLVCGFAIPSLTSIDVNAVRIGYEAAQLLDQVMNGRVRHGRPRLFAPVRVIPRGSTDTLAGVDADVAAAWRLISQQACLGLRVQDVEKRVSVSRSVLNRRFKKAVGRTPKEQMLKVQIDRARNLLVETELPVERISEYVGFSESKYFIQVFRRQVGASPGVFRRNHGRFHPTGKLLKHSETDLLNRVTDSPAQTAPIDAGHRE